MSLQVGFQRSVLRAIQPKGMEDRIDGRRAGRVAIGCAAVVQVGDDGPTFFARENGKPGTSVILEGHGSIAQRIEQSRAAGADGRAGRDSYRSYVKPAGEMEERVGGEKFFFYVGNQVSGKKEAKAPFGEKAERGVMMSSIRESRACQSVLPLKGAISSKGSQPSKLPCR